MHLQNEISIIDLRRKTHTVELQILGEGIVDTARKRDDYIDRRHIFHDRSSKIKKEELEHHRMTLPVFFDAIYTEPGTERPWCFKERANISIKVLQI